MTCFPLQLPGNCRDGLADRPWKPAKDYWPVVLPDEVAPVLPEVPELLEVFDDPLELGVDVAPPLDPMPEEAPDVPPLVAEPLDVPAESPEEDG